MLTSVVCSLSCARSFSVYRTMRVDKFLALCPPGALGSNAVDTASGLAALQHLVNAALMNNEVRCVCVCVLCVVYVVCHVSCV